MLNDLVYILLIFNVFVYEVSSHGYMLTPVNRASRWRLNTSDTSILRNYDDNAYYCGGYGVQYNTNGGKCGPCGDNWLDPTPRSNENTGTYGNGVVVATYKSGSIIKTNIRITTNHLGKISYQLCKLNNTLLPETEECFQTLTLLNGETHQIINKYDYNVTSYVQLPDYLICDRCVLRWHYSAGNNWGSCGNGTSAVGCGPQETFRSCADIRILPSFFWFFRPFRV
ncbi:uncharacterized protein LOC126744553 [Anthonomus grandis grandis]|uniref:uncharacterized protein LOC126744553 n=1 Tax=Anthonomus grandis grandis TaxID=2921223 RepID=UPI00216691B1|nr:uncharacterized protein LOC126744553 [Anthonomus grandis grandis]